ncbi:helix-turn-helix domain-containing protein [Streptomyces coffeae]|uniref:helix-turn-helix domain-containing protein n=1 Tax=Streptomyces coffeae TaxID=621382 RepID=UPI0027DC41A5|nr:helix-turn-helix domain-containing protein [Streptomyces coffeae]
MLVATRGHSNARIARDTGLHRDTVRTWRGRFAVGRAHPGAVHARRRASLRFMSMVIDHSTIASWTCGSVS